MRLRGRPEVSAARTPLSIGIAGFGRLVRDIYLPAFRRLPGARLVAVADPLPQCRSAAAHRLPRVAVYPDHRTLLDRANLDGLLVASPPSTHLEIWRDASARGVAVFMEKPFILAGQLGQIERRQPDARLMLDLNRRFWPPYRRVADLVRGGELGKPVEVEFLLSTDVLSWSTVTRHRLSPEEGGILHDLGGHAIDLAADLLGEEPESVTAAASSREWEGDSFRLDLAFTDGSAVRCRLGYSASTCERLSVRGPRGRLSLRDPNMAIHLQRKGTRGPRVAARLRDATVFAYRTLRRDRSMTRFTIRKALDSFVHALAAGEPFSPGFDEAVRNVRWLDAAERSVADGSLVKRPA
jgi:predicted dehydrogenase